MIGIFDSGIGGLTILKAIKKKLPNYSYLYLGDSARAPYGSRSQEVIYEYTRQAVDFLFKQGCQLIILACNTASAEALRRLQKEWLPENYPDRRILGVIRPVVEEASKLSKNNRIAVIGTTATVNSGTYSRQLKAQQKGLFVLEKACPLLVPLIEEGWQDKVETKMILKKYLRGVKDFAVDTLILGCTHYPLLAKEIKRICGKKINVLNSAEIVAEKTADYLNRHPELDKLLAKNKTVKFLTTDLAGKFDKQATAFWGGEVKSEKVSLN
jgi:glutamate racemase